jgi:hypothetical protein
MNLYLAIAWLILAITVLVWQTLTGDKFWSIPVGEYQISYGWLMFVLVLYNLKRWRDVRRIRKRHRQWQAEQARQMHEERASARRSAPQPADPELKFTDGSARAESEISDRPAASE